MSMFAGTPSPKVIHQPEHAYASLEQSGDADDAPSGSPREGELTAASVDVLGLSRRARNALIRSGVRTLGDLQRLVESEGGVESLYGIGQKSAAEIHGAVAEWMKGKSP